ncbi:hypothetical protein [Spirosoma endbachense]|uniref:Uncharacterized protein n=1 Tax=Spirosoma endbachense TaxID=2666025 RepID=A0A6P1W1E5_9BACT|nr:hypothetical protein [Spirosoma endbachense]QHV99223.1 hypothetical protein GJR95_31290 [Spirosoma endbachense]
MRGSIDTRELFVLDRKLARTGRVVDARFMGRTMRVAVKPMLDIAKREVPIGQRLFRSQKVRRLKSGKTKRDGTYDKGGATKRSLRILVVPGSQGEVVRVLVGASKKRGYAGWRTHLITRPNIHRRGVDDFLSRAESQGGALAEASLTTALHAEVEKELVK